jgi:flagellum-specific ATP synthase
VTTSRIRGRRARAILDGHIVLSRDLAEQGHYPAIDIEASISRAMNDSSRPTRCGSRGASSNSIRAYADARDLINVGAYVRGADPDIDEALRLREHFLAFLRQDVGERADYAASRLALAAAVRGEP